MDFTSARVWINVMKESRMIMRKTTTYLGSLAIIALLAGGCAGPTQKLGRGVSNVTEFARLGELQRSIEQTALQKGNNAGYTTGVVRGLNRSVVRTVVGAVEIVTFPIPSYDPWLRPGNQLIPDASVTPIHPDAYTPALIGASSLETDASLGFSGGDVAPFIPGSRFRIYDF